MGKMVPDLQEGQNVYMSMAISTSVADHPTS